MGDVHLTRELLDAAFGDERSPRDLVPVVLAHLFSLCPKCEKAFEEWRASLPVTAALTYGEIASKAIAKAMNALDWIEEQEALAKPYLEDLVASTVDERTSLASSIPAAARTPALAKGLVEAAREAMPSNPRKSLALAQLARTFLQHSDLSTFVTELYGRSVAYIANAMRVLGSLPEAAETMAHARFILRQEGGGDRLTRSELDNLEGMIRLHQRDYDNGESLLKRAMHGFRFSGAEREAIRSEINLGILYRDRGDLERALETRRRLVERLEPFDDPKLLAIAFHNLSVSLCEAGEFEEAEEWHSKAKPLLNSPIGFLRSEWLQGMIAHGRRDFRRAESHFSAAQYGFRKLELEFDTALVSLELACVYLEEDRLEDVKSLAGELVHVFERQGRLGESLAALRLFRTAAEMERVTYNFIRELALYLRQAALDPSHRFRARTGSSLPPTPTPPS